jgi:hypothetical protein
MIILILYGPFLCWSLREYLSYSSQHILNTQTNVQGSQITVFTQSCTLSLCNVQVNSTYKQRRVQYLPWHVNRYVLQIYENVMWATYKHGITQIHSNIGLRTIYTNWGLSWFFSGSPKYSGILCFDISQRIHLQCFNFTDILVLLIPICIITSGNYHQHIPFHICPFPFFS